MALLARAQFRNDMRFRLAVLGILPLTIIYLLLGSHRRGPGAKEPRAPGHGLRGAAAVPAAAQGRVRDAATRTGRRGCSTRPRSAPGACCSGERTVLVRWFLGPYVVAVGLSALVRAAVGRWTRSSPSPSHPCSATRCCCGAVRRSHAAVLVAAAGGVQHHGVIVAVIPAIVLGQLLPTALTRLSASPALAGATVLLLLLLNVGMDDCCAGASTVSRRAWSSPREPRTSCTPGVSACR